jgi:two-component system nitrogen regulation sensor histidine kinase NtrY
VPEASGRRGDLFDLIGGFNRMTQQLKTQREALVHASETNEKRRQFTEAVVEGVSAGIVGLDALGAITLVNARGCQMLGRDEIALMGEKIGEVIPQLGPIFERNKASRRGQVRDQIELGSGPDYRTYQVQLTREGTVAESKGYVLTLDDITDLLSAQRTGAWADVARRIAHEIKNPLTPIQLAAERLQRRFGQEVSSDKDTFDRLTATIVRQVGDLRRMVDEFSNFARMPKPAFRDEDVHEIARQALFLHEVAHPSISFALDPPQGEFRMVCDRRQLAQALTNVVKNGVEAIEGRKSRGEHSLAGDRVELKLHEEDKHLVIDVLDTGVGLPEDRERLTEPYMTTRVRGTGLGLAIVKKIVEEHMGEISFLDRPGGGTHVRISFDTAKLGALATDASNPGDEEQRDSDEEA